MVSVAENPCPKLYTWDAWRQSVVNSSDVE